MLADVVNYLEKDCVAIINDPTLLKLDCLELKVFVIFSKISIITRPFCLSSSYCHIVSPLYLFPTYNLFCKTKYQLRSQENKVS